MLQRILGIGSGSVDDLNSRRVIKQEEMSSQPIEYSTTSWQTAPPSTSVTGTSELFSSTFAMLSDNATYNANDVNGGHQWGVNNKTPLTQSILFEQPQIQPISSSFDPPVRFDPPYAYRQQQQQQQPTYSNNLAQHYYIQQQQQQPQQQQQQQQIRVTYAAPQQQPQQSQQQQFYQPPPTSSIITSAPQTQQLLMAPSPIVMRPEPLRPTNSVKVEHQQQHHRKSPQVSRQQSNTVSPCDDVSLNSPGLTSSGSAASGTPPLNADNCGSSTDLEGPDEERVMCIACRGVYPSRRSLTGHIGRNEKCREIIGRNYLDAVASGVNPPIPGTDAAIKSGAITTGQDGMSPVCPFCDRFISHYKGNIRRHINQCCKNTEPIKRPSSGEMDKNKLKRRKTEDGFHQPDFNDYDGMGMMNGAQLSPQSSSYYGGSDLCSPNGAAAAGGASYSNYEGFHTPQKNGPKREQAPPDDAYICEDCDFVTVYKGNMKRHLNTCHPVTDCKNLKVVEWDMKLESMRASNMGIVGDRLQEKLALHKQNSSRGRKPRKKKENQNSEESEPLIDEYKPTISNMPDSYVTYAQ